MALASDEIKEDGKKGKAVYILHTWKDYLWELGGGGDVPEVRDVTVADNETEGDADGDEGESTGPSERPEIMVPEAISEPSGSTLSPQGKHASSWMSS